MTQTDANITANGIANFSSVPDEDWLGERWLDLLKPFTSDQFGTHATWHALQSCYSDPVRHYHTLAHVEALLRLADAERERVAQPVVLEFAIWFHDAIYDPRSGDNEERSAAWARQAMEAMRIEPALADQVEACILATRRHELPDAAAPDLALFLDLDLSILGAPDSVYDAYSRQVRQEYTWVPDAEYRVRRAAVLERFSQRERLFFTPHLAARFEAQARRNIARELQALRSF